MKRNRLQIFRPEAPLFAKILVVLIAIAGVGILLFGIVTGIQDAEHYRRVWQDPITVTAEVTRHDEQEDSESGTDFLSYITYTVDGKTYRNVCYENESSPNKRTPLGTQVSVQVSPEDPGALIKDLRNSAILTFFSAILSIFAGLVIAGLRRLRLSRGNALPPARETVEADLMVKLHGRNARSVWLAGILMLTALILRYPMLYGGIGWKIALGVCAAFWLWCLYSAIRDSRRIRNGEFQLFWDTLVRKEETTDSDGDSVYRLHYSSLGRTWSRNVGKQEYQSAEEGSKLCAVYLHGHQKPTVHYDELGNAR